jgi:hypothetical protein
MGISTLVLIKVTISILVFDLFPHSMIIPECISPIPAHI